MCGIYAIYWQQFPTACDGARGGVFTSTSCFGLLSSFPATSSRFQGLDSSFPDHVLVCSRDGSVYSFELDKGDLQWQYNVGDPITASAFVDEHLLLKSDSSRHSDRLICICSSSGCVHILAVNLKDVEDTDQPITSVQEFARLNLEGDIFSSPVMIGGRIFVGCRDDYLHCISLEIPSET